MRNKQKENEVCIIHPSNNKGLIRKLPEELKKNGLSTILLETSLDSPNVDVLRKYLSDAGILNCIWLPTGKDDRETGIACVLDTLTEGNQLKLLTYKLSDEDTYNEVLAVLIQNRDSGFFDSDRSSLRGKYNFYLKSKLDSNSYFNTTNIKCARKAKQA